MDEIDSCQKERTEKKKLRTRNANSVKLQMVTGLVGNWKSDLSV
jgi:hypothetical protein